MLYKLVVLFAIMGFALASVKELTEEEREQLAAWKPGGKQKMWELSGQVEGDMVFGSTQRNGLISSASRWRNNVIPYEVDRVFSAREAAAIHDAVREFANVSCVTVRPRTSSDRDFVRVTGANTGCWSWVGRQGGRQDLNLQRQGCIWHEIIVHEFLHAAGFFHEQSSYNRDNHVTILWNNIVRGMEHNFEKYGRNLITTFGQPYDYGSVMHYHEYAFSRNGNPTIRPRDSSWIGRLGLARRMSDIDRVKLNRMYNC